MKYPAHPFCLLLLALTVRAWGDTGMAEGRVILPSQSTPVVLPQRYDVVTTNGAVATNPPLAVVYLEGDFPRPANPRTVELAQKDMAFVPSLLPIQVGTKVEFANQDDTFHNVFSFSPTKRFDLGRYRPSDRPVPTEVFDTAGLVTLRCEIHKHMRGLILVLDTPYFVVSDADGHYRLTGLPEGKYLLKAWINSRLTYWKRITVVSGETVHTDFP